MKALLLGSVVGLALINAPAAHAMTAYTDDALTLHAGPGANYPAVEQLSKDTRLWVIGCRQGLDWCDVTHGRMRGWVRAPKLGFPEEMRASDRIPLANFNLDSYWKEHYRHEAFYADRERWRDSSRQVAEQNGVR